MSKDIIPNEPGQVLVRFSASMLAEIDRRRKCEYINVTRQEWIRRALAVYIQNSEV